MRIPRFHLPAPLHPGQILELPDELFRHAIQVLRMKAGEPLTLFNGEGGEYLAQLQQVGKRSATLLVESFSASDPESSLHLTLVQSVIKPDKMDFALQKAVELGIAAFQPIVTQRSVVRMGQDKLDKKLQHWQAVAISACEQCGRTRLPEVRAPLELDDYLSTNTNALRLILAPGDFPRMGTLERSGGHSPVEILIGPEGGFTEEELSQCLQAGVQAVSLGPRILRAETASVTALALLQHHYGDI